MQTKKERVKIAKKKLKQMKNTKVDIRIPDEPYELHEDTEIAALLVAAKAEAGPVTISDDEDDDHHHDDGVDSSRLNQPENKRLNLPHDG